MWNSRPVRLLWHSFNWLTRVTIIVVTIAAMAMAVGIIILRYWVLPDIEQYHEQISASLSRTIGRPVTIGKIAGDWHGYSPRLSMVNLAILDNHKKPALVLPNIRVSVSWLSLLTAELRFADLEFDRPELLIRRDEQGNLFVGSIPVVEQAGSDNSLADWLLHQPHMVARNALIIWHDEQRHAPPLVLESVDVLIESLFGRHRFAIRAVVPIELASPLDIRGDFYGSSLSQPQKWHGQVFTQLDKANIAAWRPWLNLPKELSRGRGSLRGWLDVTDGQVSRVQVDLAVKDVATRLGADVPEMLLSSLNGRATWHQLVGGFELETKELTMQVENGVRLLTTDLYLRILNAQNRRPASGEIRANQLRLRTLVSLANFLPIPADLRAALDSYAPNGKVEGLRAKWQGLPTSLQGFSVKGKFDNISVRQVGQIPGFTGLSAEIDGDQNGGTLSFNSHQLSVEAPSILREPLYFKTLAGSAKWGRKGDELKVEVPELSATNDDLEGKAYGSYQTLAGSPGILNLDVQLTKADVRQVARYTPLIAVNTKLSDWLHDNLLAGSSNDFHLRILGDLNHFPFDNDPQGKFELKAKVRGGAIRFAPDWPTIENANGEFVMDGKRLEALCADATTLGVPLHDVSVIVPDITLDTPSLQTKLSSTATTREFLQYVHNSPVRAYAQGYTDTISARGKGDLEVNLRIPKLGEEVVELQGIYRPYSNEIDLGGNIPIMHKVNGELHFSDSGLETRQLTAQILGGPAEVYIKTTPNGAIAKLSGKSNLDVYGEELKFPLLSQLHGEAAWTAQVNAENKSLRVQIASNLQGVSSTLPLPFTKIKEDKLPLTIALQSSAASVAKAAGVDRQIEIDVGVGSLLSAKAIQQTHKGVDALKRVTVNFGGQGKWSEQDGIWLVGSMPEFSMQGWGGVLGSQDAAATDKIMIAGADLLIKKLTGYGFGMSNLHVVASKRGEGVAAQLEGQSASGEVIWQPHGYQNATKMSAHLKKFVWPGDLVQHPAATELVQAEIVSQVVQPSSLPTLDVTIDDLIVTGNRVGHLELAGNPEGDSWRLRRLILTDPDGNLSGDGVWLGVNGKPQTKINLTLGIENAGRVLDRSGYPKTVKDGKGKLIANLSWQGAPADFNLKTLEGSLNLNTGKGQFLKVDPGVGKLLGVMSLQALPKRIALDFTDVFSEGFQFDSIKGTAQIHDGQMKTQDFRIEGSAAKVTMKGGVNLLDETQDLRVEILPNIGSGVSLISAFAINPIFGVSTFVVDKLLGNPLDKLVSFEYNVSGTWADPTVVKLGQKPVSSSIKDASPE